MIFRCKISANEHLLLLIITNLNENGYDENHSQIKLQYVIIKTFSLYSICIGRKYWIREKFRLPIFNGFTCFEMS